MKINNDIYGLCDEDFMNEEELYDDLILYWEIRKENIIENCKKIKEELLSISLHPNRVIDWCLDMETKNNIKYIFK